MDQFGRGRRFRAVVIDREIDPDRRDHQLADHAGVDVQPVLVVPGGSREFRGERIRCLDGLQRLVVRCGIRQHRRDLIGVQQGRFLPVSLHDRRVVGLPDLIRDRRIEQVARAGRDQQEDEQKSEKLSHSAPSCPALAAVTPCPVRLPKQRIGQRAYSALPMTSSR